VRDRRHRWRCRKRSSHWRHRRRNCRQTQAEDGEQKAQQQAAQQTAQTQQQAQAQRRPNTKARQIRLREHFSVHGCPGILGSVTSTVRFLYSRFAAVRTSKSGNYG